MKEKRKINHSNYLTLFLLSISTIGFFFFLLFYSYLALSIDFTNRAVYIDDKEWIKNLGFFITVCSVFFYMILQSAKEIQNILFVQKKKNFINFK